MKRLTLKILALVLFLCAVVMHAQSFPIRGSFFVFDRILGEEKLNVELDEMKSVGISEIFVASSGVLTADGSGLPTGYLDSDGTYFGSTTAMYPDYQQRIKKLLDGAGARGMKVYLGSMVTASPWYETYWQAPLRTANKTFARDVMSRYGSHSALAGFYFAQEIELNWAKNNPSYYGILWVKDFVTDVNALNAEFGKQFEVSAAPIFKKAWGGMPTLTPAEFDTVLGYFLSGSGVKLVMPQDGIGANTGGPSLSELSAYFAAARNAVNRTGARLYSDVEIFTADGGLNSAFLPAPISRIQNQVSNVQPYVHGMVMWNFGHQMSNQATYNPVQASNLQRQYKETYGGQPVTRPVSFTYSYMAMPEYSIPGQPAAAWGDLSMTKLNNGTGGGYANNPSWVGFLDTANSNLIKIRLSLPSGKTAKKVRLLCRSESNSFIKLPQFGLVTEIQGFSEVSLGSQWFSAAWITPSLDTSLFSVQWLELPLVYPNQTNQLDVYLTFVGWLMISEVQVME